MADTNEQGMAAEDRGQTPTPRTESDSVPDLPAPDLAPEAAKGNVWRAGVLVVLAAMAAYYNSYGCQFILDDNGAILTNTSIRHLWPLGPVLRPPSDKGQTVGGRPLLNLSLAINYAVNGTSVRGYHIVNLAIHVLAALLLLEILRRTFLLPCMGGRFNTTALGMATVIALLWTVHPVQAESVTYISQRAESMVGMFYLLTLYCVIRASAAGEWGWSLAAVLACALGMASKEVMVTAPVMVLLFDRTFLAGSFRKALRTRWAMYVGLAACWGLLAYDMYQAGTRGGTAGSGQNEIILDRRSYALTELGAILHYLKVSFWPHPLLVYWYGSPSAKTLEQILPGAITVATIAVATVWGLLRGRKWGFLGAWFLVILAPTSSVVPILSPIFEHRIYLSLAAPMTLVVLVVYLFWQRLLQDKGWFAGQGLREQWLVPTGAATVIVVGLVFLTYLRNLDYRSMTAVWQDLAAKADLWEDESENRSMHSKIHNNLGLSLVNSDTPGLALDSFRRAIRLDEKNDEAYINYGAMLHKQGDISEAMIQFDQAIEINRQAIKDNPRNVAAYEKVGSVLCMQGRAQEGLEMLRQAVRIDPEDAKAANALGVALCGQGKIEEGMATFRQIIASHPDNAEAYANLGQALYKLGKVDPAIEQFHKALSINPRFTPASPGYKNLLDLLERIGRADEATDLQNQAKEHMLSDTPQ